MPHPGAREARLVGEEPAPPRTRRPRSAGAGRCGRRPFPLGAECQQAVELGAARSRSSTRATPRQARRHAPTRLGPPPRPRACWLSPSGSSADEPRFCCPISNKNAVRGRERPPHWLAAPYLTVSVPSMPASRWPGHGAVEGVGPRFQVDRRRRAAAGDEFGFAEGLRRSSLRSRRRAGVPAGCRIRSRPGRPWRSQIWSCRRGSSAGRRRDFHDRATRFGLAAACGFGARFGFGATASGSRFGRPTGFAFGACRRVVAAAAAGDERN